MQSNQDQQPFVGEKKGKHALVVGATGATGKDLLELLLIDDDFYRVDVFVRRDVQVRHEKLMVHIIDFDKPEQWKALVKGDVLFSCLGTTLSAAGSKSAQWKIDYDYQFAFASAARQNGVPAYVLVSSSNASAKSFFFYTKMKGKLEEAVKALGFPKLAIFNPPVLIRKNSDRLMEVVGLKIVRALNSVGLFREQASLPTEVLAQAMINASKAESPGLSTFKGREIWQQAAKNRE